MLSKKKINAIRMVSVLEDIILAGEPREEDKTHWLDTPPEMWMPEEKRLFDLLHDSEMKLKDKILEILNP